MKFSSNVPATPGDYKWRQTEGGTEYLATLRLLNGGLVQVDVRLIATSIRKKRRWRRALSTCKTIPNVEAWW